MTIQDVTTLELSDIGGIRFECQKCGAAVTFRLAENFGIPSECPGCRDPWFFHGAEPGRRMDQFIRLLRVVAKDVAGPDTPFRLRFEVESPEDE